jgi:gamma-glutamylcyclotransferase (GGCT)/AIG2-like uncharacterized protein YtfP
MNRAEPEEFFVYGTLRPGQPNFSRVARLVVGVEPAVLPGHVLYGRGLPFPYAAPGRGRVVGDMLRITPRGMPRALLILDALEGYHGEGRRNHYDRRRVSVAGSTGTRPAWVYLAGGHVLSRLTPDLLLPGGDWCARDASSYAIA